MRKCHEEVSLVSGFTWAGEVQAKQGLDGGRHGKIDQLPCRRYVYPYIPVLLIHLQYQRLEDCETHAELGCTDRGTDPEARLSLRTTMERTKAEFRSWLPPSLKPTGWAKIAESRLFGSKLKTSSSKREKTSSWTTPVIGAKLVKKSHRRAKSEIIHCTPCQGDATGGEDEPPKVPELPEIPDLDFPPEVISIYNVARKTVSQVFEDSKSLRQYASSVELGLFSDANSDSLEEASLRSMLSMSNACIEPFYEPNGSGGSRIVIEPTDDEAASDNTVARANLNKDSIASPISIESEKLSAASSLTDDRFRDCYPPFTKTPFRQTVPSRPVPSTKEAFRQHFPEFRPLPDTLVNEAIREGIWGLNPSELIRYDHETMQTNVPHCTASHEVKEDWCLTASTLTAYTAMRGPYRNTGRDLFIWMDRCGKTFGRQDQQDKQANSCKSLIASLEPLSQDPPPSLDECGRKNVFHVPRPPYEHIKFPSGFNQSDDSQGSVSDMEVTNTISSNFKSDKTSHGSARIRDG
ncbi:hypothetical protein BGZ63DRAFT_209934 [Mariannaea sp. PMI_226]|nr:hypothetical protein BGZ63DRAFT_209934 [Mariannaea sp. PMI_226]